MGHIPTVYTHEEYDPNTFQTSPLHRWEGERTKHYLAQRIQSVHSINKLFINLINKKGINNTVLLTEHWSVFTVQKLEGKRVGKRDQNGEVKREWGLSPHWWERPSWDRGCFALLCRPEITVTSSLRSTSWLATHELHHGRRAPPSASEGELERWVIHSQA